MMTEHTPIPDVELDAFADDAFVMTHDAVALTTGVMPPRGMILTLAKDLRESRRIIRLVAGDIDEDGYSVTENTRDTVMAYVSACEGEK